MSQNDKLIQDLRSSARYYSRHPLAKIDTPRLISLLKSAATALESNSSFLTIVEESQKYKTLVKALTGDQREEWISPPIFRLRPTGHGACVLEVKHVGDDVPFCDSLDSAIEEWQKRQKDQR